MSRLLDRDAIIGSLTELGATLDADGEHADLFVAGGAAIALAYSTRRATRDLDAVFEPKSLVYSAARDVARRHGLPDDWLNDAASRRHRPTRRAWLSAEEDHPLRRPARRHEDDIVPTAAYALWRLAQPSAPQPERPREPARHRPTYTWREDT